ncbi:hypothetical protein BGX23_009997 [Mortierella sp. AD031]|nr:hypothetical protein BGX23_009997 [Mortierella sp. AD031]
MSIASTLFTVLELVDNIGSYLDPPDLYSCVQANSAWNQSFLPSLWRTIDDSLYHWPEFINKNSSDPPKEVECDDKDNNQNWMLSVFQKHSRHIRHLRLNFKPTIDTVFATTNKIHDDDDGCIHLQSLEVFYHKQSTQEEKDEDVRARAMTPEQGAPTWTERCRPGERGPYVAPEFEGTISPTMIGLRPKSRQRTDWTTFQHFWLVVKRNRSLRTLKISPALMDLCFITSPKYFIDLLASLPNLRTLHHQLNVLDGHRILERLGQLDTFSTNYFNILETDPRRTYMNIRSLTKGGNHSQLHVALILKNFPNLECLTLGWANCISPAEPDAYTMMDNSAPLKLKELQVMSMYESSGGPPIWPKVLALSPELRRFSTNNLTTKVVKVLGGHCKKLVEFRQVYDDDIVRPQRSGSPEARMLNTLLESCPELRILDFINGSVDVASLGGRTWVCHRLETFRCQVVGLNRPNKMEEEILVGLSVRNRARWDHFSADKRRALGKEIQCRERHSRIYSRLAALTFLKVIDLGGSYRDEMLTLDDNAPFYEVDGHEYLQYGGPWEDSMELSLSSGLGRLGKLGRIEVFGFEGVDHRIQERELNWMAHAWPRLKVLRGLHVETLQEIEFDKHRAMLRKHMRSLRPEVKHLSFRCETDDGTQDEPPVLGPSTGPSRAARQRRPSRPSAVAIEPLPSPPRSMCCHIL